MKFSITRSLLSLLLSYPASNLFTNALYKDEAGLYDFSIFSSGHGQRGVTFACLSSNKQSVITSSSQSNPSLLLNNNHVTSDTAFVVGDNNNECWLSSRDANTGNLNWRRNVCTSASPSTSSSSSSIIRHAVHCNRDQRVIYTLDDVGVMQVWDDRSGSLMSQLSTGYNSQNTEISPRIVGFGSNFVASAHTIAVSNSESTTSSEVDDVLLVHDPNNLKILVDDSPIISAKVILDGAKVKSPHKDATPRIVTVIPTSENSPLSNILIVAAWVQFDENTNSFITSLSHVATNTLLVNNDNLVLFQANDSVRLSSSSSKSSNLIDLSTAKFTYDSNTILSVEMYPSGEIQCKDYKIKFNNIENEETTAQVQAIQGDKSLTVLQNNSFDPIQNVHLLQCSPETIDTLITTVYGNTLMIQIDLKNANNGNGEINLVQKWKNDEALGSVTSAILLDDVSSYSHHNVLEENNELDDEEAMIQSLSFVSRMSAQMEDLKYFVSGGFMDRLSTLLHRSVSSSQKDSNTITPSQNDYVFGLHKIIVLLSNSFSKVIGLQTASNGNVIWSLNLNPNAEWHKIVHGSTTSHSSVFGHGMHHPHSHDVLVLSRVSSAENDFSTIEWKCLDGLRGRVLSKGTVLTSYSDVVQVSPVHTHSHPVGGCRQNAILLHKDNSVSMIPDLEYTQSDVAKTLLNGLHLHSVENGLFRSVKVITSPDNLSKPQVVTIGETMFDPKFETILSVTYPQRNEVLQSPSTILGDDSLLLKYTNPHLCVVVTEATPGYISKMQREDDDPSSSLSFADYLGKKSSDEEGSKKKPVGVTNPKDDTTTTINQSSLTAGKSSPVIPTLYINLVDTVSGQILYRISHSHFTPGFETKGMTNVPVIISENWIIYAFPNNKARRSEIGVLTLFEGMIDKHGITAFSTPEQQLTFSSLSSPKPIVIHKTFAVSKPVSAIGVTNTKGGISSKMVLLATGADGQIIRIDRRLMDPRRPSGEPKLSEKKEGLVQYSPLLPVSPLWTPSYTQNIVGALKIISSAANLESQSLVFAYGGPDLFFTRIAPSKGFDSLPETFNKLLLVMLILGLFFAYVSMKKSSKKKIMKLWWS